MSVMYNIVALSAKIIMCFVLMPPVGPNWINKELN